MLSGATGGTGLDGCGRVDEAFVAELEPEVGRDRPAHQDRVLVEMLDPADTRNNARIATHTIP